MRVIHLLRKLDPAEWGGTETALHRLCDGLRDHGVSPVIYCPRLEGDLVEDPIQRAGHPVRRFKAFLPVLGLPPERRRQLVAVGGNLMSFDLLTQLWAEDRIDILHTHTLGRIGGMARAIARQRRVPFVVSIHGGVLDLPPALKESFQAPEPSGWEWGRLFGLLFQTHRLFHDADAILTCNEREAQLLRERHPEKRITVQPHGVPVDLYRPDYRALAREAFPEIRGRTLLVNVGRIDPVKNQGWLVDQMPEILRRHAGIRLVLVGPCTDEPYGRAMGQKIRQLGLDREVILTGGLPPDDPRLIGLMQEAAAVVLCSVSETFGLILLEAWAAGAVVLSSRTSGAKALIEDGRNGWLFDLEKPAGFHAALERVLTGREQARQMAAAGGARVQAEYSVRALAGRVKALYEELIEVKHALCNHSR